MSDLNSLKIIALAGEVFDFTIVKAQKMGLDVSECHMVFETLVAGSRFAKRKTEN